MCKKCKKAFRKDVTDFEERLENLIQSISSFELIGAATNIALIVTITSSSTP